MPRRFHVLWSILDHSIRFRNLLKRKAALTRRVEQALEAVKEPQEDVDALRDAH